MKESEFIELLNLYVDHEISPEDAARLEAEVAKTPSRRDTYRQYCMMHKACDVLAAHYRDPEMQPLSFMVEREKAVGWGWGTSVFAGGLLAAACLALVFVAHQREIGQAGRNLAGASAPVVAASEMPAFPHALPAHFTTGELHPVLNTRDWTNPAAGRSSESLAWMNKVELPPIQRGSLEQLPFPSDPLLLSTSSAETQVTAPAQDSGTERAAFQFQR